MSHVSQPVEMSAPGPDQVWDFSAITSTAATEAEYKLPSDLPGGDQVEGATHALDTGNEGQYQFYSIDQSSMEILSLTAPGQVISEVNYDPARLLLSFPLSYNASYSQPFQRVTEVGPEVFNIEIGTITGNVDAYGTLTTPAGTFNDVLRVRIAAESTLYTVLMGDTIGNIPFSDIQHQFFTSGIPFPLYTLQEVEGAGQSSSNGFYSSQITLSADDQIVKLLDCKVYPNPSKAEVNIEVNLNESTEADIQLMGLDGRVIKSLFHGHLIHGRNNVRFDVSGLSPGIYLLNIRTTRGTHAERLVVVE